MYWAHRFFHANAFWRNNIHYAHHQYTTVFSWAGGYVHPVETLVTVLCQVAYPCLSNNHPLSFWTFIVIWVILLIEEHSGHSVWWSPHRFMPAVMGGGASHDSHHSLNTTKNFSFVFSIWDTLFNTRCTGKLRESDTENSVPLPCLTRPANIVKGA